MRQIHEEFVARTPLRVSSERSFGLVFAAVFTVVAVLPLGLLLRLLGK